MMTLWLVSKRKALRSISTQVPETITIDQSTQTAGWLRGTTSSVPSHSPYQHLTPYEDADSEDEEEDEDTETAWMMETEEEYSAPSHISAPIPNSAPNQNSYDDSFDAEFEFEIDLDSQNPLQAFERQMLGAKRMNGTPLFYRMAPEGDEDPRNG